MILADEPTGNLDSTMSSQIMDLLESINVGYDDSLVTHNELAQRARRKSRWWTEQLQPTMRSQLKGGFP